MSAEGVCKTCTTSYVCRIKFTEINARLSKNNRQRPYLTLRSVRFNLMCELALGLGEKPLDT